MREQNSTQENQVLPNGLPQSDATLNSRSLEKEDALMDPSLDSLLARASVPMLRAGFADRVIQSVQPASLPAQRPAVFWISSIAAALALCTGAMLWKTPTERTDAPQLVTTDEERLIAALRSPDLSGEDLAIVANLGEVLEAELIANHPLWLDEK